MSAPAIREILFPTDFSAVAAAAGRTAAEFARHFAARLHVLHVVPAGFDLDAQLSNDLIRGHCRARIRGEALEHKWKDERVGHTAS